MSYQVPLGVAPLSPRGAKAKTPDGRSAPSRSLFKRAFSSKKVVPEIVLAKRTIAIVNEWEDFQSEVHEALAKITESMESSKGLLEQLGEVEVAKDSETGVRNTSYTDSAMAKMDILRRNTSSLLNEEWQAIRAYTGDVFNMTKKCKAGVKITPLKRKRGSRMRAKTTGVGGLPKPIVDEVQPGFEAPGAAPAPFSAPGPSAAMPRGMPSPVAMGPGVARRMPSPVPMGVGAPKQRPMAAGPQPGVRRPGPGPAPMSMTAPRAMPGPAPGAAAGRGQVAGEGMAGRRPVAADPMAGRSPVAGGGMAGRRPGPAPAFGGEMGGRSPVAGEGMAGRRPGPGPAPAFGGEMAGRRPGPAPAFGGEMGGRRPVAADPMAGRRPVAAGPMAGRRPGPGPAPKTRPAAMTSVASAKSRPVAKRMPEQVVGRRAALSEGGERPAAAVAKKRPGPALIPPPLPPGVKPKKNYKGLWDYVGGYRKDGELLFKKGDYLVATDSQGDWLYGYRALDPSLSGWFPGNYCEPFK